MSARPSGLPRRSLGRSATRWLLLVALAASSLALTQCKMVGDRLTGVSVDLLRRKDDCIKQCKDVYKEAVRVEKDQHKANVIACGSDPTCLTAEEERYQAALLAIDSAFVECIDRCHNQGSGTVGP